MIDKGREVSCIIVFVKYPEKGRVKTRLAEDIGSENAAELYKRFTEDILESLTDIKAAKLVFFCPRDRRKEFMIWLGGGYQFYPQLGNDLGERMKNAFTFGFKEGYQNMIILGSDSPDIPKAIIKEALNSLLIKDAVIGPAQDGGYYLIGFKKDSFNSSIFERIEWGANTVYGKTVDILNKKNISFHVLPQWRDIDTYEDMKVFFQNNQNKNMRAVNFIREENFE